MEIEIISKKHNPLLNRKEVQFSTKHDDVGSTPPKQQVRRALANILKEKTDFIFITKLETKTGTHTAIGLANIYSSLEEAKLIEPKYIIDRNNPSKPVEEEKQ
ncbi:MAG: 30S ribosomal protein S24e [Candidatus Bathyarchaeota archaeon]|jgi:small subunit ribosomal protein S24e